MTEESMQEKWGARRLAGAGVALLMALLTHAPALSGQEVRGTVRDSASNLPLPNTVILVLDPSGRPAARSTTDAQGHFRVVPWGGRPTTRAARTAANLRLRVLRMGFRPHEVPLAQVAGGTSIDVLLSSFPINLEVVEVVAAPSCPKRPDRPAVLALLQQVRMALYANVLARSQNSASTTQLLYARRFAGDGGRVVGQTVQKRVTSGRSEPFNPARSAAAIDGQGFREEADGQPSYLAPDAETIVDADFAENHCFRIMAGDRNRPRQMGLGFEPAVREDTGHIDIVGTLWVDTLSRVLRDLSFRYVGLDRQTRALGPEGRMSFRELSNGVVVVDKWSLRLAADRGERGESDSPSPSRSGEVMAGVSHSNAQEIGGEVGRVSWPDGYSWSAPLGALRLRAVDGQGRPAGASVVTVVGTNYEVERDGDGSFVVSDLLPGPYSVTIRDPRLTELNVPLTSSIRFTAVRDSTTEVRVQVETADDFAARRCGADARGTGKGVVLARVVSADGRPVSDARWSVRDEFGSPLVEGGRVDPDGLLQWCQAPMGKRVTIEAWREDRRASMSRVISDPLATLRFELPGASR
jgi:hypothetical protein